MEQKIIRWMEDTWNRLQLEKGYNRSKIRPSSFALPDSTSSSSSLLANSLSLSILCISFLVNLLPSLQPKLQHCWVHSRHTSKLYGYQLIVSLSANEVPSVNGALPADQSDQPSARHKTSIQLCFYKVTPPDLLRKTGHGLLIMSICPHIE